jgi:hypothetical protein
MLCWSLYATTKGSKMRSNEYKLMGLREIRLEDKRLALLKTPESRFQAASALVSFYAKQSGSMICSWCMEGTELIIMAQGGDPDVTIPSLIKEKPSRESLLMAAAEEEQRATEYQRAYAAASDHNTAMGYLDLASEAKAAASALAARASTLD